MYRIAFLALFFAASASATPPMTHQGRLLDTSGAPIAGPVALSVSVYDAANLVVWSGTFPTVAIEDGYYTVILGVDGDLTQDELGRGPLSVGIAVNGGAELSARQTLGFVPYAGLAGGVQLGSVALCDAGTEGTLRWTGNRVEVCDGAAWASWSAL